MGNIVEVYEYSNPVWSGFYKNGGRFMSKEKFTKGENRKRVLYRIRNDLRRLTNFNFNSGSKFVTLTFEKNMTDIRKANYEFSKFIQRLQYRYGDFKYVAVIEFQKRGAVHYHMISDLEYVKNEDLRAVWGNGYVKINRIKQVDNVGAYIIKYMNKEMDDKRLHRRKSYLRSNNLGKPKRLINFEARDFLEKNKLKKGDAVYDHAYKTEHYGNVTHKEFNLKQSKKGKEIREKKFLEKCERSQVKK